MRSLSGPEANILINKSSRACLADFSLVTIVSDQSTVISSWIEGGSIPWMSPELLDPGRFGLEETRPTKESDCYALGMVIYEVFSGKTPFAPHKGPTVIVKVMEGKRPRRSQGHEGQLFTDVVWGLMKLCWEAQPGNRPSAETALLRLEESPPPLGRIPNVDEGAKTDGGDPSDVTAGESSMFSPFRLRLTPPQLSLWFVVPLTIRGGNRPPVPQHHPSHWPSPDPSMLSPVPPFVAGSR